MPRVEIKGKQLYNVVKVYRVSRKTLILRTKLTEEQALAVVRQWPDSKTHIVCALKM
jgi:hypothetical protein